VIQALRMVGGSVGAAVLGSVLNGGYHARLQLDGVPAAVVGAVRDGVTSGVAVADRLGSAPLRADVVGAYLHGMSLMLATSAGLAAVCAGLAVAFLPRRGPSPEGIAGGDDTDDQASARMAA
jgi:MFS transporter, DHA2 family, multidrug resistance protein